LRPLFIFIASAIILSALALAFPDVLLNPGPLMQGHQALKRDCLSCHKPFNGAASVQCISCHKQNVIGIRNVAGSLISSDPPKTPFHGGLSANSCVDCHTDHKGLDAAKTVKTFRHELLSESLQKNCIECHRNKKPEDDLHKSAQANCSECHSTTAWKPASFDHSRYFTLDSDHKASCKTCHTDPGNYKKYTCYNCHEHTPANMAAVHREEGIYNYQNCMKCHRDGKKEGGESGGEDGD